MQKIVTFLWFENQAEEAAEHYVSVFPDSRVLNVNRYSEGAPIPAGTAMLVTFQLAGQDFMALNGGPHDKFNDAISLCVNCETQAEIDELWDKLTADGGEEVQCGWLKDRFGVSWQIVPTAIADLVGGPDPAGAARATQAMLQMKKLDIAALRRAYEGE